MTQFTPTPVPLHPLPKNHFGRSTKAKFVDDLAGMHAIAVAAGMHSSLVLLDTTSETPEGAKARAAIAAGRIGLYEPKEPAGGAGAAAPPADADAPAASVAGSKRKAGGAAPASSARGGKGASGTKKR